MVEIALESLRELFNRKVEIINEIYKSYSHYDFKENWICVSTIDISPEIC